MKHWTTLAVMVGAAVGASVVRGHHSVAGVFDSEKPFELTGVITDVEWINPHVYVHLEAMGEGGESIEWQLETVPTAFMRKAGISKAMPMGDGELVTVTGIEAHVAPNVGWIQRITYADGHYYQISGS